MRALPDVAEREPPQDFDAEQAVIGSMLLESEAARLAFSILTADDFYRTYHKQIFAAMVACRDRKEPIDLVTVSSELRRTNKLDEVGGGEYITALIGEVPTAAHVVRYAGRVAECAVLRNMITTAAEITSVAYSQPEDIGQAVKDAEKKFQQIARARIRTTGRLESMAERADHISDMVAQAGAGQRPLSAARLGISSIDGRIGPLSDHRIILVKGNTGSGKTHIGVNAVGATALELKKRQEPGRIIIFSFESEGMYERRLLAWLSGINNEDIRRGFDGEQEPERWNQLWEAGDKLTTLPIYLSEKKNDQAHIEEQWMDAAREGPVVLAVMDYWQAMKRKKGRQQIEEYAEATATFRDLLDQTQTPGLIISQVTENFNSKSDAPGISKGSTDIQDAATMIMRLTKDAKINCEKMRIGPAFSPTQVHIEYETSRIFSETEWGWEEDRKRREREARNGGGGSSEEYLYGDG